MELRLKQKNIASNRSIYLRGEKLNEKVIAFLEVGMNIALYISEWLML